MRLGPLANLSQDWLWSDYAIGSFGEVRPRERRDAAQLVTAGVAGVARQEETHMGIALAFAGSLGETWTQAIPVCAGADDPCGRIVGVRVLESGQRVDHRRRPGRRWSVKAWIELMKEQRQKTIRLVAFGNQEPVELRISVSVY